MYGIEAGKPREDLLGLVFKPRHLGYSYSLSIATLKAGSWPVGLRQPFLVPWSYELSASHGGGCPHILAVGLDPPLSLTSLGIFYLCSQVLTGTNRCHVAQVLQPYLWGVVGLSCAGAIP